MRSFRTCFDGSSRRDSIEHVHYHCPTPTMSHPCLLYLPKDSMGHASGVMDLLDDEIDRDHDVIEDDIT